MIKLKKNQSRLELLATVAEACHRLARDDFFSFRTLLDPDLIDGWWQREIAAQLMIFEQDLFSGNRPKLVIMSPPQFGKSTQIIDFIAYLSGKNPDLRTIYGSFSERLGIRANLRLQRIFDGEKFRKTFPGTRINGSGAGESEQFLRNRDILEFVNRRGYFRNTTVRGSITGESLDLGVIDDPIKGRAEANSITVRNTTWDWLNDDFFTRFSEKAGFLCILTRWHSDDPIGRLLEADPTLKVLRYPALAEHDEVHRKKGESLFPELKSQEFLLERKSRMATASWESLYQQNPIVLGGEIIHTEHFRRYSISPNFKYRAIFADTAQKTSEMHDYSVFQCWGLSENGGLYFIDQIRGKWEAPELLRRAKDFWAKHHANKNGSLRKLYVEDKSSGTGLIQQLKSESRIPIGGISRTTDKFTRLQDVLGYIESGHVYLPEGESFVSCFLSECETFRADDKHAHDDQIDPMVDAITHMLAGKQNSLYGFMVQNYAEVAKTG